jgi:PAS domain S-box-containing protein
VIENLHLLTQLRQYAAELEGRVEARTAELHDAKNRVEAILASVGDGVSVIDLDGNFLTLNAALEELSGFPAEELAGTSFLALLDEKNDPEVLAEMQAALKRGEVWTGELTSRRKGQGSYPIQLTIAPVRDQNGIIVSYVGSQRDITRQKELNRLKDQFVSDVSHELRTPTTNISLYLDLLENAPAEKRQVYIQVLKDQTFLLRKLVEDILDLSRLAVGRSKKTEFTEVDLNVLVEDVITAHQPQVNAANIQLSFNPAERPTVQGDPGQISRVITNLVSNAVRYTPKGEVRIRTYQNNGHVCLEVGDTGMGIDPEDQPHLFERFYRGVKARQSKIHGTGLGLAIAKEIVSLHAGQIEFQSELGKGSTFRVWLPVNQDKLCLAKQS